MHSSLLAWLSAVLRLMINMLPVSVSEQRSLASVEPCILADVPTDLSRGIVLSLGFSSRSVASQRQSISENCFFRPCGRFMESSAMEGFTYATI